MKLPEWYDPEDDGARQAREIRMKLLPEMFEASPEFKLWREFSTALQEAAHETAPTVVLPARFLRLVAGQIRDPDHYPLTFPVLEQAFNRLVTALRLPPSFRMPPAPAEDEPPVTEAQEDELYARFEASDEYRRWRAFADALDGIEHGTAPAVEVPTAFVRIAPIGLDPFRFDVLRDVWNRLCDNLRLPESRKESR